MSRSFCLISPAINLLGDGPFKLWSPHFLTTGMGGWEGAHWALENWYVTLQHKWVISVPNGPKIIQFDTQNHHRFLFCNLKNILWRLKLLEMVWSSPENGEYGQDVFDTFLGFCCPNKPTSPKKPIFKHQSLGPPLRYFAHSEVMQKNLRDNPVSCIFAGINATVKTMRLCWNKLDFGFAVSASSSSALLASLVTSSASLSFTRGTVRSL